MADFSFLQNPVSKKWVVLAPRRAKRPDMSKGTEPVCPFCLGREVEEPDVYRVGGTAGQPDWQVRVLNNKFPFAPIHEVIVHSPDHHKNIDELPLDQTILLLQTYQQRYQTHQTSGQVYIFHNRGEGGGESLPHPHSQLAVVPAGVKMDTPRLDPDATVGVGPENEKQEHVESEHFYVFCPNTSQWPDEVWIAPKNRGRAFGEITDVELEDFAKILSTIIKILDLRHGHEFPFNYYIYPGGDWYLRLIPRFKSMGGFEVGTGIFVNTQNPTETMGFIKDHFSTPDFEKIKTSHQSDYRKHV